MNISKTRLPNVLLAHPPAGHPWAVWVGPPVVVGRMEPDATAATDRAYLVRCCFLGENVWPGTPDAVTGAVSTMLAGVVASGTLLSTAGPEVAEAELPAWLPIAMADRPEWFGLMLPAKRQIWEAIDIPDFGDPEVAWVPLPGEWGRTPSEEDAELAAALLGAHIREGDLLAAGQMP